MEHAEHCASAARRAPPTTYNGVRRNATPSMMSATLLERLMTTLRVYSRAASSREGTQCSTHIYESVIKGFEFRATQLATLGCAEHNWLRTVEMGHPRKVLVTRQLGTPAWRVPSRDSRPARNFPA
jgi:hypothetical protein